MNKEMPVSDDRRLVNLISRYATPLALFLGGLAVAVSDYGNKLRVFCLGLLVFSALFNYIFPRIHKKLDVKYVIVAQHLRMAVNLLVNTFLVYALGESFNPIWLIMALSPFATAIYTTLKKTMETAATSAVVLITVHLLRNPHGFAPWADLLGCIAFIVIVSAIINAATRNFKHEASGVLA